MNVGLSSELKKNEIPQLIDDIIYAYCPEDVFNESTTRDKGRAKFVRDFIEYDFIFFKSATTMKFNYFKNNIDSLLVVNGSDYGYQLILSYCKKIVEDLDTEKDIYKGTEISDIERFTGKKVDTEL